MRLPNKQNVVDRTTNVDIPETKFKRNIHSKGLLNTDRNALNKHKLQRLKSLEFDQMKLDVETLKQTVKALQEYIKG